MKKMIRLATALFMSVALFSTTSCDKKDEVPQEPLEVQLLTAKTWQIEEVSSTYGGTTDISYKRGASNNEEDFSSVRQTFKKDGSITYVDEFGDAGTNGHYKLMDNHRMEISMGGFSSVVENVTIGENSISYRLVNGYGYTQFTFAPLQ